MIGDQFGEFPSEREATAVGTGDDEQGGGVTGTAETPDAAPQAAPERKYTTVDALQTAGKEAIIQFPSKRVIIENYAKKVEEVNSNPEAEMEPPGSSNTELGAVIKTSRDIVREFDVLITEAKLLKSEVAGDPAELKKVEDFIAYFENESILVQQETIDIIVQSLPKGLLKGNPLSAEYDDAIKEYYKFTDEDLALFDENKDKNLPPEEIKRLLEANPSAAEAVTLRQRVRELTVAALGLGADLVWDKDDPKIDLSALIDLLIYGPGSRTRGFGSISGREAGADGNIEIRRHEFMTNFKDTNLVGRSLKRIITQFQSGALASSSAKNWVTANQEALYECEDNPDSAKMVELFLSFQTFTDQYSNDDEVWNDFNIAFTSELMSGGSKKAKMDQETLLALKEMLAKDNSGNEAAKLKTLWKVAPEATKSQQPVAPPAVAAAAVGMPDSGPQVQEVAPASQASPPTEAAA